MTLLDQRIVAGIGNVYKSEVLFLSGVHPEVASSEVPLPVLEAMMDTARRLLRDNVVEGTSGQIQTYRNLRQFSVGSSNDENLWVYGRRDKPCRKCATPIEMKKMGLEARSTYWCPSCQKLR
jgi:endonuclease-8